MNGCLNFLDRVYLQKFIWGCNLGRYLVTKDLGSATLKFVCKHEGELNENNIKVIQGLLYDTAYLLFFFSV